VSHLPTYIDKPTTTSQQAAIKPKAITDVQNGIDVS